MITLQNFISFGAGALMMLGVVILWAVCIASRKRPIDDPAARDARAIHQRDY